MTFCFYLLYTFRQNFSKIDSPGKVAAVVFEMRCLEKLNIRIFVSLQSHGNTEGGYKFVPEKMFSGIKSDFSRVLLDSSG